MRKAKDWKSTGKYWLFGLVLPVGYSLLLLVKGTSVRGKVPEGKEIEVIATSFVETNIPDAVKGNRLVLDTREAEPDPPGFFFTLYKFFCPATGNYRFTIRAMPPGMNQRSRFTVQIDDGPEKWALGGRIALPDSSWVSELNQGVVRLSRGEHVITVRMRPEHRTNVLSRIDFPDFGHNTWIENFRFSSYRPSKSLKPLRKPRQRFALKHGDRVLFFGDSITDEGYYLAHILRLVSAAYPEEQITFFNAGIGNNRTRDAVHRVDWDVLALKPTWVIVALGVNDNVHQTYEEFEKHYDTILFRCRKAGVKHLALTTPAGMALRGESAEKTVWERDHAAGFNRTIEHYNAIIEKLARKYDARVLDVFARFQDPRVDTTYRMGGGQLHPSRGHGARLWALAVLHDLGFSHDDVAASEKEGYLDDFDLVASIKPRTYDPPSVTKTPSPVKQIGPFILVSSFTTNSVVALDLETGKVISKIPVAGHHPMGIATSQRRRRAYVVTEGDGRVTIIDLQTLMVSSVVEIGDIYPDHILLSPDENQAYIGTFYGASIAVVDLEAEKKIAEKKMGGRVGGLMWSEDGNLLATLTGPGRLLVIEPKTLSIKRQIEVGGVPMRIVPIELEGTRAAVGIVDDFTGSLMRVDLRTGRVVDKIPGFAPGRAEIKWPSDGSLWIADWEHGIIWRSSADGSRQLFARVNFPVGMAIVDGQRDYFK